MEGLTVNLVGGHGRGQGWAVGAAEEADQGSRRSPPRRWPEKTSSSAPMDPGIGGGGDGGGGAWDPGIESGCAWLPGTHGRTWDPGPCDGRRQNARFWPPAAAGPEGGDERRLAGVAEEGPRSRRRRRAGH